MADIKIVRNGAVIWIDVLGTAFMPIVDEGSDVLLKVRGKCMKDKSNLRLVWDSVVGPTSRVVEGDIARALRKTVGVISECISVGDIVRLLPLDIVKLRKFPNGSRTERILIGRHFGNWNVSCELILAIAIPGDFERVRGLFTRFTWRQ